MQKIIFLNGTGLNFSRCFFTSPMLYKSKFMVMFMIYLFVTSPQLAFAKPSFEETKGFIYSKFNKYKKSHVGWRGNRREITFKSSWLRIDKCEISTGHTQRHVYYGTRSNGDRYKSKYTHKVSYIVPAIDLLDINYQSFQTPDGMYADDGEERVMFEIHMKNKPVQYNFDRNKEYKNDFVIFLNYLGGERDLGKRMTNAFKHLGELARNNSECKNKEIF